MPSSTNTAAGRSALGRERPLDSGFLAATIRVWPLKRCLVLTVIPRSRLFEPRAGGNGSAAPAATNFFPIAAEKVKITANVGTRDRESLFMAKTTRIPIRGGGPTDPWP